MVIIHVAWSFSQITMKMRFKHSDRDIIQKCIVRDPLT